MFLAGFRVSNLNKETKFYVNLKGKWNIEMIRLAKMVETAQNSGKWIGHITYHHIACKLCMLFYKNSKYNHNYFSKIVDQETNKNRILKAIKLAR